MCTCVCVAVNVTYIPHTRTHTPYDMSNHQATSELVWSIPALRSIQTSSFVHRSPEPAPKANHTKHNHTHSPHYGWWYCKNAPMYVCCYDSAISGPVMCFGSIGAVFFFGAIAQCHPENKVDDSLGIVGHKGLCDCWHHKIAHVSTRPNTVCTKISRHQHNNPATYDITFCNQEYPTSITLGSDMISLQLEAHH